MTSRSDNRVDWDSIGCSIFAAIGILGTLMLMGFQMYTIHHQNITQYQSTTSSTKIQLEEKNTGEYNLFFKLSD